MKFGRALVGLAVLGAVLVVLAIGVVGSDPDRAAARRVDLAAEGRQGALPGSVPTGRRAPVREEVPAPEAAPDAGADRRAVTGVLTVAARVYEAEGLWLPFDAPSLRVRVEGASTAALVALGEAVELPAGRYVLSVVEETVPAGFARGFELERPAGDHFLARWMDGLDDPRGRLSTSAEVVAGEAREALVHLWPLVRLHGRTLLRDEEGERGIGVCHVELAPQPVYSGRARTVETDALGAYEAWLRPGVYRARLRWGPADGPPSEAPRLGYHPVAPPTQVIDLRGMDEARLDLAYEPVCSVAGELRHARTDAPLADVEVELARIHRDLSGEPRLREDGTPSWGRVATARTDAQGRYRIEHVSPGLYRVTPRSEGHAPPVWHNVESLRDQGLAFHEVTAGENDLGVFHALPGGPAELELVLPAELRGADLRCEVEELPWAARGIDEVRPFRGRIELEPWSAPERVRLHLWPPNPPLRVRLLRDDRVLRELEVEPESVWPPGRVVVL